MNPQVDSSEADLLNDIGNFILSIDYRWIIILAIAIATILFVARYCVLKIKPDLVSILQTLLAFLSMYTGVIIGSAFLLVSPPAIDAFEPIELASIALISLVTLITFGIQQLSGLFVNDTKDDTSHKQNTPKSESDGQSNP